MAGICVSRYILGDILGVYDLRIIDLRFILILVFLSVLVLTFICRRRPLLQSIALYTCALTLGMALGGGLAQELPQQRYVDETLGSMPSCYGHPCVVMSEPAEKPKTVAVDLLLPGDGGTTFRCYLRKDERSLRLKVGDELVVQFWEPPSPLKGELARGLPLQFVRSNEWQLGGGGKRLMTRWQRMRLSFLLLRHRLLERLRGLHADDDAYAVLAAMTLGDKSALSPQLRNTYSVSGASHVLALSGLHLGIVYGVLTMLMLRRRRFWLAQVLTVLCLWAFAFLTGLSPSITRSALMLTVYAIFSVRSRGWPSVNVLCFAAIIMLLVHPSTLFEVSFQMSFASVFSILMFMPFFDGAMPSVVRHWRVLRWLWGMVAISVAAQLGVAPLIAYYFGRFSTYFILTNFLVIPAAFIILWLTPLVLLVPQCGSILAYTAKQLNNGISAIAELPCSSIDGLHPSVLQVALIYLLIVIAYLILRRFGHVN